MRKFILALSLLSLTMALAQSQPNFHRAHAGIIIVETDSTVRALEPFGGVSERAKAYASAINHYADSLGSGIQIYNMVIPTAVAYYCPSSARQWTKDERKALDDIQTRLSQKVKAVDIYTELACHRDEAIYLRTDHHWAPLGAYYAAQKFATVAGVPFRSLADYDTLAIHNFVGTMFKFSRDAAVKRYPEDFVYFVPRDSSYTATFIKYSLDRNRKVTGESEPVVEPFFKHYNDGSGAAYCTFMGGDTRTVAVDTDCHNGRRLMIVKDSYGNALPPFLFASFEKICVVDFRYFQKSIVEYVKSNGITDILFANNIGHAYTPSTATTYEKMLLR